jgi:hypothetical protein
MTIKNSRRGLLLAGLGLAIPAGALAQAIETKQFDAGKLMPYLEQYLTIAPAERDAFRLEYLYRSEGGAPPPTMTLVQGSQRTALRFGAGGLLLNPPTSASGLRGAKVEVQRPAGSQGRGSIAMNVVPVMPLGAMIPAAEAIESLNELAAATRRFAGVLGFAAPRIEAVLFTGVASGQAVMPNGGRANLAIKDGKVRYRPLDAAVRGATQLVFPNAPTRVDFDG